MVLRGNCANRNTTTEEDWDAKTRNCVARALERLYFLECTSQTTDSEFHTLHFSTYSLSKATVTSMTKSQINCNTDLCSGDLWTFHVVHSPYCVFMCICNFVPNIGPWAAQSSPRSRDVSQRLLWWLILCLDRSCYIAHCCGLMRYLYTHCSR